MMLLDLNLTLDQGQDLDPSQMVLLDWHLHLQRLRGHSSPTTIVKMKLLLTSSWLRPQRYHRDPHMILLIAAYETDSKLSYAKLAKMASKQQDELESLCLTMQKSQTLLIDEIEKGQTLTNEHVTLKEKYDELYARHDLLSADHEKLNYEFLERKIALKKLKEAHEELENINLTLKAQQGSEASSVTCLTCLDCDKLESAHKGKGPII